MDLQTVGIVSTGEMGCSTARVTAASGQRPITVLRGRSRRTRANPEAAGVVDVGSPAELARQGDVVLSVVPPTPRSTSRA